MQGVQRCFLLLAALVALAARTGEETLLSTGGRPLLPRLCVARMCWGVSQAEGRGPLLLAEAACMMPTLQQYPELGPLVEAIQVCDITRRSPSRRRAHKPAASAAACGPAAAHSPVSSQTPRPAVGGWHGRGAG